MKTKLFFSALFLTFFIFLLFSCGSGDSGGEVSGEKKLSATVNGEEWIFYNVNTERSAQGLEITGQGYLEGNRETVPMNIELTVTGLPPQGEINTPFEALFAPNTTGNAAKATITPVDRPSVFDTGLDENAQGKFIIKDVSNDALSGEFSFVATDKGGRSLKIENGSFSGLSF